LLPKVPAFDRGQLPSWEVVRTQVAREYTTAVKIDRIGDFRCIKAADGTTQVWDWQWEGHNTDGQSICRQDAEVTQQGGDQTRSLLMVAVLYRRINGMWQFWKSVSRRR
jgi:hypothetical protein